MLNNFFLKYIFFKFKIFFANLKKNSADVVPRVDVWRDAADRHVQPRGPRVPQDHAVQLPRRHQRHRAPQQRQARRGLDGRLEAVLLQVG